jgi:hypothetical protein
VQQKQKSQEESVGVTEVLDGCALREVMSLVSIRLLHGNAICWLLSLEWVAYCVSATKARNLVQPQPYYVYIYIV